MAKLTLLEMTQNILSALNSDPVSNIDETVESVQVVEIIRESFYELMSSRQWPFLQTLTSLEGLGDTANPTRMRIPEGVNKLLWVKYNKKEIFFLTPDDFYAKIRTRLAMTGVIDNQGYGLNSDPTYYTSFDDKYITFDSRDQLVDNTLQQSKSDVFAIREATFTLSNDWVPDIPEKFFPLLLSEAKAQAFVNLKQQANGREERKAQRHRVMLRGESWRSEAGEPKYNRKVNYGRK
jgi:hypothetical protein